MKIIKNVRFLAFALGALAFSAQAMDFREYLDIHESDEAIRQEEAAKKERQERTEECFELINSAKGEIAIKDKVASLVKKGVNLEWQPAWLNYNMLYAAANSCYLEVVTLLLDNGASINSNSFAGGSTGGTPLIAACRHGFFDLARELIKRGANRNVYMYCTKTRAIDMLKDLANRNIRGAAELIALFEELDVLDINTKGHIGYVNACLKRNKKTDLCFFRFK